MNYENPEINFYGFDKSEGPPFGVQIKDQDGELIDLECDGEMLIVKTWNTNPELREINSPYLPFKLFKKIFLELEEKLKPYQHEE